MFRKPVESEYASYNAYALAALGYAVCMQGVSVVGRGCCGGMGGVGDVDCVVGGVRRVLALGDAGAGTGGGPRDDGVGGAGENAFGGSGVVGAVPGGVRVDCGSVGGPSDAPPRECGGGSGEAAAASLRDGGVRLVPGQLPRGPNYERNQAARRRKKEKKKASKVMEELRSEDAGVSEDVVPEWRRRSVPGVLQPRGFFSRCDEDTRRELRESRAKRLVAENELAAAKAKAEVSAMSGVVALVTQLNAVVKTAAQLEKNTSDERVKSWAKTVVDSAISELSERAPSSVPTLQSVGVSSSASQEKSAATAASSVSRARLADDKLFSQLAFEGLDPENPADAKEINRRTYVRQAAERALRQTAHWQ